MKRNNKSNFKSQIGSISVFTMLSMLFFLVVIVGAYSITSKRAQTQIQSLNEIQDKYGTKDINEVYEARIANENDKIPIYTKEQLWSIGEENIKIEIDGMLHDFSDNTWNKYELKNDIIINLEMDLANSKYVDMKENTSQYKVIYYYKGSYYLPTYYTDGTNSYDLESYTPILSAKLDENTGDWIISNDVSNLTGTYYLFAPKDSISK